ncbi:MAG: phage holin family protein [Bacteroidaceae bacterium]|nr:phage holin family protein [Bacteroidaceae bacterium]
MFSSDKNIELISQLFADAKRYAELRLQLTKVDLVSKLAILLAALILGAVLFMLFTIVILFLSYTAAAMLASWLGSMSAACAVIAGGYLLVAALVYLNRRRWIVTPLAKFLSKLFLSNPTSNAENGKTGL